ncbi:uncharacterized protein LOC118280253 isoform X2 [Spodoptera frugiperda]|uniref:Uncharacterized protein LOC118280253 isoform X2 n=1 Tax=Spodoptera frugiperda TaxID=7108 RepID=A0A9R0E2S3_SPOFR|nr:uncharacterized protein LOC118280253 isoform X2 [Spodoptera frugiperda]
MISFQLVFFTTLAVNVYGRRSEFREQCLNPFGKNYCSIKVDFKNRCEDDSSLECHVKDETLTSFSGNNGHSEVTAWSQHYIARKEYNVAPLTKVKGNSYMKMKMYKFKNNTQLSMKTEFSKKYYNVSVPLDKAGYTIERVPFTRSESDEILRNARGTFENAKLECKITESSKYVCTFNTQLPNIYSYTIHQMYSTTNNTIGRSIRSVYYPPTTVLTIKIERFDFNSTIVAHLKKYKDKNEDFLQFDLKIAERDIVKDHNYAIMSYSDTARVRFSCEQYINKDPSVGLIDSSGYKIETVERTTYNELLDVSKNGSMLCCIYYEVNYSHITRYITRIIEKKTLLLYKKDEMKGYLGLYVAIPTVLLAAAFVAVVYVCRKKKPLPNPTVPTSQPYYGNQIFPREPNRGIYILPENNDPEYEQVS